jgi:hypothetical protein
MSQILGSPYYQQAFNPLIPWDKPTDPDISKESYIITIMPRVRAFNDIYRKILPNGNYQFDLEWNPRNKAQREMVGFIGRDTRVYPQYTSIFTPNYGLFSNMDEVNAYLHAQKVKIEPIGAKGNALVVLSSIKFSFPKFPIISSMITATTKQKVKALKFINNFKVLQSRTTQQMRIFQFPTTDPRVFLNIAQTYQSRNSENSDNQPVYDFLRFRDVRPFYTDVSYQYKSITIPQIDIQLKENTESLNGMYLIRIDYKTYNTKAIQIKNFIQYTALKINEQGINLRSDTQNQLKETFYQEIIQPGDYKINTSFMIWAEHLDIQPYPLFIGYINENNFIKQK